ncbi:hypothetical protein FQN49_008648, partial [Arthroderma sp. PD_2]
MMAEGSSASSHPIPSPSLISPSSLASGVSYISGITLERWAEAERRGRQALVSGIKSHDAGTGRANQASRASINQTSIPSMATGGRPGREVNGRTKVHPGSQAMGNKHRT